MRWSVSMVHTLLLVFHQLICCPVPYKAQPSPYLITLLTSWDSKHILFLFFPPFNVFICLFIYLKSEENWWKSSQILALHTSVSRLCFTGLNELDILKGKQLGWFHLGLFRHYMRSILLLYCVDVGHSPSSNPSVNSIWELFHRFALFLKYCLFHGRLSFFEEWNQMSPKSAKKPASASVPPRSSIRPFLFYFSQLSKGSISFCFLSLSEGMQYTVGPQFDMNLLKFLCMYYIILLFMTDKYTELIFILLHFINIYITISILKCLQ